MNTNLYMEHNPYILKTIIKVNGKLLENTDFFNIKDGERIQEWIEEFPERVYTELSKNEINIEFKGIKMDYEDLKYVCEKYEKVKFNIEHIQGEEIEEKEELVRDIFGVISKGPIKDLREKRVKKIYENELEVNVFGSMGSGKSTVINAILDEKKIGLIYRPRFSNDNNEEHRKVTQKIINSSNKSLMVYIIDETTLTSDDSDKFLSTISKSMKKGGIQSRDRFIFVLNKMDNFKEGESLEGIIEEARKLLKRHNIENPIIIPLSALAALKLRKYLQKGNNEKNQTMNYMMKREVFEELSLIHNFNYRVQLEEYVDLPSKSEEKINRELEEARKKGNIVDEAIIHTGIRSLEEAVSFYLNKYFKTAKIKNISEAMEREIKSIGIDNRLKGDIIKTEDSRKLSRKNINRVKNELDLGEELEKLYEEIDQINLKIDFRELRKTVAKDYSIWMVKYIEDNRDKYLSKHKVEKEIFKMEKYIEKSLQKYIIDIEKQIEEILIGEMKEIVEKYQNYLKNISKDLSFEGVNFNMEGVLQKNISSMENKAINRIINKNTYEEEVVVGTKRKRNWDRRWYKPWTFFTQLKYYNVDIVEDKEFVNLEDVLSDMFTSVEQTFHENIKNAEKEGLYRQESLKLIYKEHLKELDDVLYKKLEDYSELIRDFENKEELERLQQVSNFVESINQMIGELRKL